MRVFVLALIAVLVASASAKKPGILNIANQAALNAAIGAHYPGVAVLFHKKKDCPRCKEANAVWKAVAERLKDEPINVALASADVAKKDVALIAQIYEIRTFPTILIFRKNNFEIPTVYTGPVVDYAIAAALTWQGDPMMEHLKTEDDVKRFWAAGAPTAMIAYVEDEPEAMKAYSGSAGDVAADIAAAFVTDRELIEDEAPCSGFDCDSPVIVLHKAGEDKPVRYEGAFEPDLIVRWAASHASPLVARYSEKEPSTAKGMMRSLKLRLPRVVGIFGTDKDIDESVVKAFTAAAQANDDMKFFLTSQEAGAWLVNYAGMPEGAQPPVFMVVEAPPAPGKQGQRYVKSAMRVQDLPEFIEEFKVGALKPFVEEKKPEEKKPAVEEKKAAAQPPASGAPLGKDEL